MRWPAERTPNGWSRRCPVSKRAPASPFRRSVTGKVSIVAHRGASALAPENTMSAFRLAAEMAADLIEFDVHLTADDEVVVIHDETLERTTNGVGRVRDRTLAEIRALDASSRWPRFAGERVPTLDEVVGWARGTHLALSLEIKQPPPLTRRPAYPDIARRVADVLTAHGMVGRTLVHSFDHPTVREMRDVLPEVATAVLYGSGTFARPLLLALPAHASGIHPWWASVSPEVCRAAHDAGMHVHAWGMSDPLDPAVVEQLASAGVDSLDTGDPAALAAILSALGLVAATTAS